MLRSIVFMFVFTAFASCGHKPEAPELSLQPVKVTTATAGASSGSTFEVSGKIEAAKTIAISTRIMGFITGMPVNVGDKVRKGQLLFTVSATDLQARRAQTEAMIAQAEAAYRNAQKDKERFTALYKQESATAKELDNVSLQYDAAKSALDAAKQMRNEVNASFAYTQVTAPFDGVITSKQSESGSIANPGMPVMMLETTGNLRVAVAVPETMISHLHEGDKATISIASLNQRFEATITEIDPSTQFTGGQYSVKLSIPDNSGNGLKAGMYVTAAFENKHPKEPTGRMMIPVQALVEKDQLTGVYTISADKKVVLRWIRTGKQSGNEIEVLSGLKENEAFILTSEGRLFNGAPVIN